MSISNCSACSASATTAPITGAVTDKKAKDALPVPPVAAAKPTAPNPDKVEAANVGARVSDDTLSALLSFAGGA